MEIRPKFGIAQLLFGMKEKDVIAVIGEPDRKFEDEDSNVIYVYNLLKLRLTFYEDENFRLGYITTSNPQSTVLGIKILGRNINEVTNQLTEKGIKEWETEEFDISTNYFNERNWLILEEEFNEVVKVEIGAIINDKDEFEWKFR